MPETRSCCAEGQRGNKGRDGDRWHCCQGQCHHGGMGLQGQGSCLCPGHSSTLCWVMPKRLFSTLDMGVRVVAKARGWIQGRDAPIMLPETHFPAFPGKKVLPSPLQPARPEVSFPWGLSTSQDLGPRSPPAPPAFGGEHRLGTAPSCPGAMPFPMRHPSLAAWELKISEMQGITGCLNISLL